MLRIIREQYWAKRVFKTDDTAEDVDVIAQKMYVAGNYRAFRLLYQHCMKCLQSQPQSIRRSPNECPVEGFCRRCLCRSPLCLAVYTLRKDSKEQTRFPHGHGMVTFVSSVVQSDGLFREETLRGSYISRSSRKWGYFMHQKRLKVPIRLSFTHGQN